MVADQRTSTSTKDEATAAASDLKDEAAGQARAVGHDAKVSATAVVDTAKGEARAVGTQLQDQARTVVHEAGSELEAQLNDRLQQVAGTARERSQHLRALADGRPEEAGPVADWARTAADQLERMAERAQQLGPRGVAGELAHFARRRPLAFLASAATAGFVVGRLARNAKEAGSDGNGASPSARPSTAPALPASTLPPHGAPAVPGAMADPLTIPTGPTGV